MEDSTDLNVVASLFLSPLWKRNIQLHAPNADHTKGGLKTTVIDATRLCSFTRRVRSSSTGARFEREKNATRLFHREIVSSLPDLRDPGEYFALLCRKQHPG